MKRPGLKAKIRAHIKAKERGKREYEHADELLNDIIALLKPGQEIAFDMSGRKAKLVDNFADGNTAFRAHGIKRFELKVI